VDYVTVDGTAASGFGFGAGDYRSVTGRVTFSPGATNRAVPVSIVQDTLHEQTETMYLILTNATWAFMADAEGIGTIENDDPAPVLSVDSPTTLERNTGLSTAVFTVNLSTTSALPVSVDFATADQTAQAGSDYFATSGTLTFAPGDLVKKIPVTLIGDIAIEPDETFALNFSNPQGATLAAAQAIGTIINDDGFVGDVLTFEWSAIGSPQAEGVAIPVTLTARDFNGQVATNFNGQVQFVTRTTNVLAANLDFEAPSFAPWTPLPGGAALGPRDLANFDVDGDGRDSSAFRSAIGDARTGIEQDVWLAGGIRYVVSVNLAAQVEAGGCWAGPGWAWLEIGDTNAGWYLPSLCFGQISRRTLTVVFQSPTNGFYPLRVVVDQTGYPHDFFPVFMDNVRIAPTSITPAISGNFNRGVWFGAITVLEPATGVALLADDGDGHRGESAMFNVLLSADLSLGGQTPLAARVNQEFSVRGDVLNYGPSTASGVVLSNFLAPGLSFISAVPSQGSCSNIGNLVVCDFGTIPVGGRPTVTILVRAPATGNYTNRLATASTGSIDPSFFNNSTDMDFTVFPPALFITLRDVTENPGGTNVEFVLTLTSSNIIPATVEFATENGSARAPLDFVATNGSVTFPPGVTNQLIRVAVLDDSVDEEIEQLILRLSNPVGAEIDNNFNPAFAQILDDDPPPVVSINDMSLVEGDAGNTNAVFTVTLSTPSERFSSVSAFSAAGTAAVGSDFTSISVTVPFPPGATSGTVSVPVRGNTVNEPDETFVVVLNSPVNATLGRAQGTGMILNDDAVPGRLDHFGFSAVPSPQIATRPIALVVTALDAFNIPVTNFTGPIAVSSTARTSMVATAVSPNVLSNFISGVWTGAVSLAASNPYVVLKINDGQEHVGQSNPFDVWLRLPLTVELATNAATEGDGVRMGLGRVTVLHPRPDDVVFQLASSDEMEALVPPTVTLPAGETNALFDLTIIDDARLDGSRPVTIRVAHPDYGTNSASLTVHDNETAALTLTLPASMNEKDIRMQGRLDLSAPPATNVSVLLTASPANEISLPQGLSFAPGQTSVVFFISALDDNSLDGPQVVTLTAHVQNWADGVGTITVFDNESTNLTFQLQWQGPYPEGRGVIGDFRLVRIGGILPTNLTMTLASSDTTELILPPFVVIPAGQTSASFSATLPDDAEFDGTQYVTLTATAPGFGPAMETIPVTDNDPVRLAFNRIDSPRPAATPFNASLLAYDINGTNIGGIPGPFTLASAGDHGPVDFVYSANQAGSAFITLTINSWDTNIRLSAIDTNGLTATSNPFDVPPPAIQYLPLTASDFAWEPVTKRIYASASANSLVHANRLAIIDPERGAISSVYFGGTPGRMAIGDLGQFVYVSLPSFNLVRRWNVAAQVYDLDIALGPGIIAEDLAVQPGHPEAVAISRRNTCCSPRHVDTVLYDNGVARSNTPAQFPGANLIEFGETGARLYGYESETTGFAFIRMTVDPGGIMLASTAGLWTGFDLDFKYGGGRVYSTGGQIYDAESGAFIGTVPWAVAAAWTGPVAPDAAIGRAFYARPFNPSTARIEVTTLTGSSIGFITLTNAGGPMAGIIRWGDDGLAVRSGVGGIALVRSPLVGDTDSDGLPDAWERQYFGGLNDSSGAALADADGDGLINVQELQAGTSPTNMASTLALSSVRMQGGDAVVEFPTVAGKRYRVDRTSDLPGGWQMVVQDVTGTGGMRSVTDTGTAGQPHRFYRVQLQQ